MKIKIDLVREKILAGTKKLGYSQDDAQIIADVLMYAQMRGNNQGITKIATGGVPEVSATEPLRLVKENKIGAFYSGGHSMVASVKAADKAIELAQHHGIGVAVSNHTHSSSGAIGYYARRIARAGYISLICVGNGDWAAVAPAGSAERKLGTNPLAYAFPYGGGEVVFDTATAAIAYFGVIEAKLNGEPLPKDVALNSRGEPTTSALEVLGQGDGESVGGAICTFAGYKGFGLSLFVQLMGSAFCLAGYPGGYGDDGAGTFILAIDPGLFAGKDEYMKRSSELMNSIKSAKPIAGQTVRLPGERGDELVRNIEMSGEMEIADAIWNELVAFVAK